MKHKDDAVNNGNVCPHCGELDSKVLTDTPYIDDTLASVTMECTECDKSWTEYFTLEEIEE